MEWEDLAHEKNLTDEVLRNIVIEVEVDKGGLEWLDRWANQLNPNQRDTDPAPIVYIQVVEKFAMVRVWGVNSEVGVNFSVEVAATLKDVLTSLPAIDNSSKLEVVVIFSYDTRVRAFTFGRVMCPLSMLEFSGRRRIKMRTLTILLGGSCLPRQFLSVIVLGL